jgi:hypothetical protein
MGIFSAQAAVLSQTEFNTHLRWKIKSLKKQIQVKKSDERLVIKTLDEDMFEKLSTEILKLKKQNTYIKKVSYKADNLPVEAATITIELANDSIELFTFYKDQSKDYVLDFWENKDVVATKKAAIVNKPAVIKVAKPKVVKRVKKPRRKITKKKKKTTITDVLNPERIIERSQKKGYRDFRYGSAFIWDYDAFIPPLEKDINTKVKTPDFLYSIKDREFKKDKKESHMQLTINFYKKSKWGLMNRSINLYTDRYGKDKNAEINEYLKANSLIRNIIKPTMTSRTLTDDEKEELEELKSAGAPIPDRLNVNLSDKAIFQTALNLLSKVGERTSNYDLKVAAIRYVLQDSVDRKDHIKSLQIAKKLYVEATEQFDDAMIIRSSKVILNSLANLRQLEKIKEFLSAKAVMRVLPKQEGHAYISFVNLAMNKANQVISYYEANKRGLVKPIHPAILYNTAEAYFREASYDKAVALFDEFIAGYSFFSESSQARLRVAVSYDLLNKDIKKTLDLYKSAINFASVPEIRYEAKVRYVGIRAARKKGPTEEDKEIIVFLEQSQGEKRKITNKLRKLLWLTRLRTMINSEKYADAIAYLSTIPLDTLKLIDKRTFEGEGAEIVLGLIKSSYLKKNYSKAVKTWEIYKEKYENKVASSTYLNFIIADSYLKLGFKSSFNREFDRLKNLKDGKIRTFPRWVSAHKNIKVDDYIVELEIEKRVLAKDWKGLSDYLESNRTNKNINYNYYKGVVSYELKEYNKAVASYENILVNPNINNFLSPAQSQNMLTTYIEALNKGNDSKRFRKNVSALVNDLRRSAKKEYKSMLERFEYLYVESLYSEKRVNFKLILTKANDYLASFVDSSYKDRVKFLKGVSLIQTSQEAMGEKVLKTLLTNKETPEYLKGLARTELSTLAIKNKTL